MPSKTTTASAVETPQSKLSPQWQCFVGAKLVPETVICDVIHMHPADEACKTKLIPTAENMMKHYYAEHGGGFQVKFRQTTGPAWQGWSKLDEAKFAVVDLKCEACDKSLDLSSRDINNHLRPHQGKFRGAFQNNRNTFFLRIQDSKATRSEDDDESPSEDSQ